MKLAEKLAGGVTTLAGSTTGFLMAILIVVLWAIAGPFFDYSEAWQLIINTGTTIITFLMVFLIQRASAKDVLSINTKLDELIRAIDKADNKMMSIENLSEQEIQMLHLCQKKSAD